MIVIREKDFVSFFNPYNGFYFRTGLLDEVGFDTGKDPFRASFPQLIDIGVMGHCRHGLSGKCRQSGCYCYQNGQRIVEPNMSFNDFHRIVSECRGKSFQFALGGRGDPNQHEDFEKMLIDCRKSNIIPNYTTSAYEMTTKQIDISIAYCGGIAISWYAQEYTLNAIEEFYKRGKPVNIHYIVSRSTINGAIKLLEEQKLLSKINAIIFLLYKPVGDINYHEIVYSNSDMIKLFFEKVSEAMCNIRIGFDSCFIPMILQNNVPIHNNAIDTCESARFSCYISPDLVMYPCSFIQNPQFGYSIRNKTIKDGWDSEVFKSFFTRNASECDQCRYYPLCLGGCPQISQIVQCRRN